MFKRFKNGARAVGRAVRRGAVKFVALVAAAVAVGGASTTAAAQTTGTNAVSLIVDNVTNARDSLVPIAIGATVLFIAIAAGVKFWRRIFK